MVIIDKSDNWPRIAIYDERGSSKAFGLYRQDPGFDALIRIQIDLNLPAEERRDLGTIKPGFLIEFCLLMGLDIPLELLTESEKRRD